MPIKLRDNEDLLLERLGRLIDVLESKEFGGGGDTININREFENRPDVDEPSEENTASYFSTGAGRLAVPNTDEFVRLDFGFLARTINLRTTDDVELAFANPNRNGSTLTIRSNESPFTVGGDAGIDTAFLWIRKADTAQDDPGVEIIAYR